MLLDKGANIDATTDSEWPCAYAWTRWTALHRAANRGHVGTVKILLNRGASINATTDTTSTALHEAAEGGYIEVVKMLLERGARGLVPIGLPFIVQLELEVVILRS